MRICLDTNVFIAAVEQTSHLSDVIWKLFTKSAAGGPMLVTSELTLAELLVGPFSERSERSFPESMEAYGDTENAFAQFMRIAPTTLAATYGEIISDTSSSLDVVAVDRGILILSAYLRSATRSLKLPDAIHLATAEREECTHLITDDRRMRCDCAISFVKLDASTIDALSESMR